MAEKKKHKHAGHGFKHMHIEHHKDGSGTMHLQHEDGSASDVKRAVGNLDQMHDAMQDHMGTPNPGEAEADAGPEAVAAGAAPETSAGVLGE